MAANLAPARDTGQRTRGRRAAASFHLAYPTARIARGPPTVAGFDQKPAVSTTPIVRGVMSPSWTAPFGIEPKPPIDNMPRVSFRFFT
jgi:hypothetical protein